MSRLYTRPAIDARPVRATQQKPTLEHDTEVVVLFRGGPPIVDMYDQKDYVIPPIPKVNALGEPVDALDPNGQPQVTVGEWRLRSHAAEYFTLPYEVAEHLKARAVVPGTRNPDDYKKTISQLAIPEVDPKERCVPFTEEQVATFYGEAYRLGLAEGLNRSLMRGSERHAQVFGVAEVNAQQLARGRDIDSELAAGEDHTHIPRSDGHEALAEVAQAEAQATRAGISHSPTRRGARFK